MIRLFNDLFGSANTNRSTTGLGLNCCQETHKYSSLLLCIGLHVTLRSLGPLLTTIRNLTQIFYLFIFALKS